MPKFTIQRTWCDVEASDLMSAIYKTENMIHDEVHVIKNPNTLSDLMYTSEYKETKSNSEKLRSSIG